MNNSYPSYDEVQNERAHLSELSYQHWIHDDFLTWKWWLLLVLSILPWIIWWKFTDKTRRQESLLYGTLITIFAIALDNVGTELLWWGYPDKLFQMIPPLFPADISLVPTSMMMIYQLCSSWRTFLISNTVFAAFLAFVGEPIFIWLDYYELNSWKLVYSFLFYIIAGVLAKWIIQQTADRKVQS
ncbi:CBO0543 family protein [Paenibacillus cremeus]|uniref:Uncharacterized protein n=1 Tax=Paenibacillus cremeus TaxID=2163881 RepID=A0A559K9L0_9BACL|nr:CBO0543 family protein [Paenibacillus cremeus]TVY08806.1 hypothetical protein FPZ49_17300 [Paenibacillus cremeus]